MIKITLTEEEERQADEGGRRRQERAIRDGRKDCHGFDGDPLAIHIFGVSCEIAVYKAFGMIWKDTPYEKGERDLPDFEIRGRQVHWYDLLIWPSDHKDRTYIHVTKEPDDPEFRIYGFITGKKAMQEKYWKKVTSRPASFFIPPNAGDLIPIEDVIDALTEEENLVAAD